MTGARLEPSPVFVTVRSAAQSRTLLRRLYYGLDGYDVPRSEEAVVLRKRSSPLYGEIMPAATDHLFDYLELGKKDVLYDLGSGVGKMVMQAGLSRPLKRCVGIELVKPRHEVAIGVLREAKSQNVLQCKQVEFLRKDIMACDLSDATALYCCSTGYPQNFLGRLLKHMSGLPAGTRFVSLQDLDENPWFELKDILRLDMSWGRRVKVHVYLRGAHS